jgi:outer membrane protein insertion porin family
MNRSTSTSDLSVSRPASRFACRFLDRRATLALAMPSLLVLSTVPSVAQEAGGKGEARSIWKRVRLAQAQTNTPAAAPEEGRGAGQPEQKLEIPDGEPAESPGEPNSQPAPETPATPATPADPADATPGTNVLEPAPGGETPTTPGSLQASEAEGQEIADVRVVGNRVVPAASILTQITSRRGGAFATVQVDRDRAKIDSLGFFASVQYQVTPNLEDPRKVDLAFVVTENRVVTGFKFASVGSTSLQVPEADLIAALESKTGSILNRTLVNNDVTKVQTLYRERGFAALVTDVRQGNDGIVTFSIQEAKISKVEVEGLKKTRPGLVRRQIRVSPGETFDQAKLRRDLNRIYDLGFFEDVTYKIDEDPATTGALILTIQLKERRTGQFTFGLGFDSRSKLTGFVTLAENNLRGTGKRAFASVEAGAQRTFDLGFGDPFVGERDASYDLGIFSRRIFREPRAVARVLGTGAGAGTQTFFYEEQRVGGRLNYTLPLNEDRTTKALFGYRNERARLFQTDLNGVFTPINNLQGAGRVSALSAGFLRDKRDLQLDPSRGGREQIIVEQAFKLVGGDVSFTKIDLDIRRYFPLIREKKAGELPKLVAANRLVIGKSFGQLPPFEQYFIGGTDTVRGYDTDTQLGDNQIYNNFELRYRLQKKFQIVGFVDAGKAAGGRFATEDKLLYSVGVGVRLTTPLGPIRLDVGNGRDGVRTHFAIGASF